MSHFSLNNKTIQSVYAKHLKFVFKGLICLVAPLPNKPPKLQFAVIISRQIKNKPLRNKIKRQIRALIIANAQFWQNWTSVFIITFNYLQNTNPNSQQKINEIQKQISAVKI